MPLPPASVSETLISPSDLNSYQESNDSDSISAVDCTIVGNGGSGVAAHSVSVVRCSLRTPDLVRLFLADVENA